MNAFLQRRGSKVDQESDGSLEKPKVREQLLRVYAGERFGRLELDHDLVLDEQIYLERIFEPHSIEIERNRFLALDPKPFSLE